MVTDKLLLTENWKDIEKAKELGMKAPDAVQHTTKFAFRKEDIKSAVIDGDKLLIDFYEEETYAFEFDQTMWNELEEYFTQNDI